MALFDRKIKIDADLEEVQAVITEIREVTAELHKETDRALEAAKQLDKAVQRAAAERRLPLRKN